MKLTALTNITQSTWQDGGVCLFRGWLVRFSWLTHLAPIRSHISAVVQRQCWPITCAVVPKIRPQTLTIVKVSDMVANSYFFKQLLHQIFCLCLLQFNCQCLYLYLLQQSQLLVALHHHCSSPVAKIVA